MDPRHRLFDLIGVFGRRVVAPVALARARLWGRRGGAALAALGAAAGAALLATVLAAGVAVEDQSLQQGITRVPEGERAARVVWGGIPTDAADRFRALDRGAAGALANATGRRPTAFMLYREWRIRGDLVDLGAGDHLERWVRLRSGRLPKTCRPERCEVVQLAGGGRLASAPGLRLVRVGTGSLRSRAPFGDLVTSETSTSILAYSQRYHRPAAPPFVLAEGVAATARIKYLADDYRSYSWVVPLRSGMLHPWSVDRFEQALTTARSRLAARSHFFSLTAPEAELDSAQRTGRVGGRRLFLLGGEAAALLLAFSVLTASALRRSAEIGRRRLTWLGARRWQLALETLTDVLALAVVGTIVGWLAGAAPAALVARHLGSDAGGILAHSLIAPTGIAVAAALAIAAAVVLLATLAVPAVRLGATSLNVLDVAAIGAVVAIVVALSRGSTDTSALADTSGTRTTLLLLPALFAFVAAVVAARAVGVLPRVLERLARRGPLPSRLALLSLARNPGRAAAAVGFLVVSVGLALFAGVYRSTLLQGQRDEAAFAFPRSVVVAEDYSQLVPVLRAAPMARYETHGRVDAVIRQSGDVPGLGSSAFTLLGLSAPTLPTIAGWRGDFSSNSLGALAEKLEVDGPSALRTVRIPASARQLELPADVRATVGVRAQIIGRGGRLVTMPLAAAGPRRLAGSIPRDARGGDLIAFAFEPRNSRLSLGANSVRGRRPFEPGAVVLGIPRVTELTGSRRLRVDYSSWTGTDGVAAHARGGRASLRFLVTPELDTRFRLRQPLEGRALPVVVSPRLAAAAGPDGILPLDVEGERLVTRVAGTASRFPGTSGDFVVADRQPLFTILNTVRPGSAFVNELWIDPRVGEDRAALAEALSKPPFDVLDIQTRHELEHRLTSDPLARGSLLALLAAAAVALALALAGLLLELVAELRDERGELFDLEAQGATPLTLRRRLRLRSAFVVATGLLGGIATGAALSALVIDLVRVTANATSPDPPLVTSPAWDVLALALAAYVIVAAVLVAVATRRAFRGPTPGRLAEANW